MKTVIQNFSNTPKAFPQNKSLSRMMTGKDTANINFGEGVKEQVEGFMKHFSEHLEATNNKVTNTNYNRYIKIDVEPARVFNKKDVSFQIKGAEQNALIEIFQILQKSRISIKNYAYGGFSGIHLGDSSLEKVFGGIATIKGVNFEEGLSIDVNNNFPIKSFAQHIYHMRFLYELTGIGLGNGEPVNFLIFNTHDRATAIEVKSVKAIVNDVFRARLGDNYINDEIGIPKQYLRDRKHRSRNSKKA